MRAIVNINHEVRKLDSLNLDNKIKSLKDKFFPIQMAAKTQEAKEKKQKNNIHK